MKISTPLLRDRPDFAHVFYMSNPRPDLVFFYFRRKHLAQAGSNFPKNLLLTKNESKVERPKKRQVRSLQRHIEDVCKNSRSYRKYGVDSRRGMTFRVFT